MHRALRALTVAAACYLLALAVFAAWSPGAVKRHQIESPAFILAALWAAASLTVPAGVRQSSGQVRGDARFWTACAAVALIGTASMWRVAAVGLLSDDYVIESWARAGRLLGGGGWFVRPVVVGMWKVVLQLEGGARSLHILNLLLHAGNALLVAVLARRVGADVVAAIVAGAVFMFWPTQIEPVFWASGMFDVFMTTCVLGTLVLTAPGASPRQRIAGLVCAGAALLSKETAVVLPVLWVVCYAWRYADEAMSRAQGLAIAGVLTLACALYVSWRVWLRLPLAGASHLTRYMIKEQLSRTFAGLGVPLTAETSVAHPYLAVLLAAACLLMLVALVWPPADGSERAAARGLVWAVVAGAPTIGYLFIGPDLEGSRYLYLPCAGWGLFVGAGITRMARTPAAVRSCAMGLVLAAGIGVLFERPRLSEQWVRAGQERDAILAAAVDAAASSQCNQVEFTGLPGRYRGAQLFTNGFPEAFARARRPASGLRACHFEWTPRGLELR